MVTRSFETLANIRPYVNTLFLHNSPSKTFKVTKQAIYVIKFFFFIYYTNVSIRLLLNISPFRDFISNSNLKHYVKRTYCHPDSQTLNSIRSVIFLAIIRIICPSWDGIVEGTQNQDNISMCTGKLTAPKTYFNYMLCF